MQLRLNPLISVTILALGALLSSGSCADEPQDVCGDGVATGSEECDGADLGQATCMEFGMPGTLHCTQDCLYDLAQCGYIETCPNGTIDFAEDCDCGSDPDNLPAGCPDINGGPDANCSDSCEALSP